MPRRRAKSARPATTTVESKKPVATDKPLRVKVAEALGYEVSITDYGAWLMCKPGRDGRGVGAIRGYVPDYDMSWKDLGPIIVARGISLEYHPGWKVPGWCAVAKSARGTQYVGSGDGLQGPLIAVCELIVEMHEAGKWQR